MKQCLHLCQEQTLETVSSLKSSPERQCDFRKVCWPLCWFYLLFSERWVMATEVLVMKVRYKIWSTYQQYQCLEWGAEHNLERIIFFIRLSIKGWHPRKQKEFCLWWVHKFVLPGVCPYCWSTNFLRRSWGSRASTELWGGAVFKMT